MATASEMTMLPVTILRIGQIAGSTSRDNLAWNMGDLVPIVVEISRSLDKFLRTLGTRDEG
jgi:hypothetical protein